MPHDLNPDLAGYTDSELIEFVRDSMHPDDFRLFETELRARAWNLPFGTSAQRALENAAADLCARFGAY